MACDKCGGSHPQLDRLYKGETLDSTDACIARDQMRSCELEQSERRSFRRSGLALGQAMGMDGRGHVTSYSLKED